MIFARRVIWGNALATLACVGVLLLPFHSGLDIIFAVPLAAFIPGFSIVSAVSLRVNSVFEFERIVWYVAASISVLILGGFIVNYLANISEVNVAIFLGIVSISGSALALMRFNPRSNNLDGDPAEWTAPPCGAAGKQNGRRRLLESAKRNAVFSRSTVVFFGLSSIIAVSALIFSEWSASTALRGNFPAIWILQSTVSAHEGQSAVTIGLQSHDVARQSYVVRATTGRGVPIGEWSFSIPTGGTWRTVVAASPGSSVVATVSSSGDPTVSLQSVHLYITRQSR